MRAIYKAASRVVVWLGEDSHADAHDAFSIICGIANVHLQSKGEIGLAEFTHRDDPVLCKLAAPAQDSDEWVAVSRLYDRDWFWRLWCVQEVALASDAIMMWGDDATISWKWVGLAAARIRTNNYQVLQRHRMAGVFNTYLMYRISLNASDLPPLSLSLPFFCLLGLTRQFEAKDPRDRIFGLLGLPTTDSDPENGDLFFGPDYTLSVLETYKRLALKVFEKDRNCDFLSSVQNGDTLDLGFPSWIPRWDKVFTQIICPSDPEARSKASGDCGLPLDSEYTPSSESEQVETKRDDETGFLKLQGIIVSKVSSSITTPAGKSVSNEGFLSHFSLDLVSSQVRKDSKRFCWTLTAGKDWYGTPVSDSDRLLTDFKAVLYDILSAEDIRDVLHNLLPDYSEAGDTARFNQGALNACQGRRLFFTFDGRLGLGPMAIQEGDFLCVLFGGSVPFILRQDNDFYRLVGECYVYDLMDGQAIDRWKSGGLQDMWFNIH